MIKTLSIIALFITCTFTVFGQDASISSKGCGTITTSEEIAEIYKWQKLPPLRRTAGTKDSIPLTIHIVGKDDGTGYYQLETFLRMMCNLNAKYEQTGLCFYIKWPVLYINNTGYYEHNATVGANMMRQNNVSNTVNVYFVQDPNGACGYYSPSGQGLAISKNCAGINSTTLTHELGHYFGLPHTFFGWENGATPGNPEKVTRGAGKNCDLAGDGFCDTDADYLADRWNCPYNKIKTDITGQLYHPDSSLYMSYASDACMTRFSEQQINWMNGTLDTKYKSLLTNKPPVYSDLPTPALLYPTDSIYTNLRYLIWNKVTTADAYMVRIVLSGTVTKFLETITSDTTLKLDFDMTNSRAYNVKIWALSGINVCRANVLNKDYVFTDNATDLTLKSFSNIPPGIRLYPNPAKDDLNIDIDFLDNGTYELSITSINGSTLLRQTITHTDNTHIIVPTRSFATGMYIVRVKGGGMNVIQKLIVSH